MDYIFASVLSHYKSLPGLVILYDIVCQWFKHLLEQLHKLPPHLRIKLPTNNLQYTIPKYHFNVHKAKDHMQYSLNNMLELGCTDSEEVE